MNAENPLLRDESGATVLEQVRRDCTECLRCVAECEFLKRHGTPKQMADRVPGGAGAPGTVPFECSLCGLCDAFCPEGLSPSRLFLHLREMSVVRDPSILRRYRGFLRFERLGSSRFLSLYALPGGCDTVFFPGCSLPGTRPAATGHIFSEMAGRIPRLGLVLDCCNRPSHDLGLRAFFRDAIGRKLERLFSAGVKTVITGCPNCHAVFTEYGTSMETRSLYEVMAEKGIAVAPVSAGAVIHDPCALRFSDGVGAAVRKVASGGGIGITEMKHTGRKTLCCGGGGVVERMNREFSDAWREKIRREAKGRRVITSCGGCQYRLSRDMKAVHLLDLWDRAEFFRKVAVPDSAFGAHENKRQ